jgi:Carboxypeptidase regulatory-like domain/TonB dependent receptor
VALRDALRAALAVLLTSAAALAQQGTVGGTVRDQTGAPLPGVTVELTQPRAAPIAAATDASGRYRFDAVPPGSYTLSFRLVNFADQRREIQVAGAPVSADAIMTLALNAHLSLSQARFVDAADGQSYVPEAVGTVVSAGASVDGYRRTFASVRWRYFGPRALVEDGSVQSHATSLVNLQAGYQLARRLRATVDVFNLFNARMSDIDYYFASRLPGEPAGGVDDIHFHPAVPRTVRAGLVVGF